MKQIRFILAAAVLLAPIYSRRAHLSAEAPVPEFSLEPSEVTVYEDRALITRAGKVKLPKGISTIRIVGLPVTLNETSIRAALLRASVARVLSVTTRTDQKLETQDERLRELEKQDDALVRERRALDAELSVLEALKQYLSSFEKLAAQGLSERTTLGSIKAEQIRESDAFLSSRAGQINRARQEVCVKKKKLERKQSELQLKMALFSKPKRKTIRYAEVVLEAPAAARPALSISYLIGNASWRPRYEARLAGRNLEVRYMGEVRQKTGEDWKNVKLILSTARPSLGANRRDVYPVRASLVETGEQKEVVSIARDTEADEEREKAEAPRRPTGGVPVVASEQGTSAVFQIADRSSVPSDRRSYKLPITTFRDDKPALSFETTPKLMRYVYLKCVSQNRSSFPMLAGPVDIFRGSGFMGTSAVPFTPAGKKLQLSFGIDEDLKVRRTRDPKLTGLERTSRKREYRYAFDTEVANYKPEAQTVTIVDNVPVADIEEVVIRMEKASPAPTKWTQKSGRMEWSIPLEPGEKKTVHLEYTIVVPKDYAWSP